jgi:hypothetical protein
LPSLDDATREDRIARADTVAREGGRPRGLAALLAAGLAAWAAFAAIVVADNQVPDAASGTVVAVFAPGHAGARALAALDAAGGRLLDGGADGLVVVVRSDVSGFAGRLRDAGAWGVFRPGGPVGCVVRLGV